jgi:hypothetical protein
VFAPCFCFCVRSFVHRLETGTATSTCDDNSKWLKRNPGGVSLGFKSKLQAKSTFNIQLSPPRVPQATVHPRVFTTVQAPPRISLTLASDPKVFTTITRTSRRLKLGQPRLRTLDELVKTFNSSRFSSPFKISPPSSTREHWYLDQQSKLIKEVPSRARCISFDRFICFDSSLTIPESFDSSHSIHLLESFPLSYIL